MASSDHVFLPIVVSCKMAHASCGFTCIPAELLDWRHEIDPDWPNSTCTFLVYWLHVYPLHHIPHLPWSKQTTIYLSHLMTKPIKQHMRPAKTQISLGIHPVWSESSLSAWRKLGSLATDWVHSEDSDQIGWMPRLIWVFAGHTVILLLLSWSGSFCWELWAWCWKNQ